MIYDWIMHLSPYPKLEARIRTRFGINFRRRHAGPSNPSDFHKRMVRGRKWDHEVREVGTPFVVHCLQMWRTRSRRCSPDRKAINSAWVRFHVSKNVWQIRSDSLPDRIDVLFMPRRQKIYRYINRIDFVWISRTHDSIVVLCIFIARLQSVRYFDKSIEST